MAFCFKFFLTVTFKNARICVVYEIFFQFLIVSKQYRNNIFYHLCLLATITENVRISTILMIYVDIQQLMGCLLFQEQGIENSPYAHLISPDAWDKLAEEFSKVKKISALLP